MEHTITYDTAGRFESDKVTNLGTSGIVDDAILRIETAYDDMSRVLTTTSYDAATAGNVVNQVKHHYNGYQLVSETEQEHDGAVDANTLSVKYTYDDGAAGGVAKYVRLSEVEYPDGREVHYLYDTGIDDTLNRVSSIADDASGTTKYAEYEYLGTGTIVSVAHPDVSGGLTLDYNIMGNYEGWDTFGRIVDHEWKDDLNTHLDDYEYTYDRNSNRTSRDNELQSTLDEDYTYDELDRLQDVNRNGTDLQEWELDSLGNWSEFTDGATTETRTHNDANELITSDTRVNPIYDAAGNMITGPRPDDPNTEQNYVYDAWNRLVEVKDDLDATVATFEYDGRNYRIQKTAGGVVEAFYHNNSQQLLETRLDGDVDPEEQYVQGLRYVDAPIVRFFDSNTDGTLDNTLYYLADANFNITGLVDASTGDVVERYHYDPYGKFQVYDGSWNALSSTAYDNDYYFTGRRFDAESLIFYYRGRYYAFDLGRFINRDPIGYEDGYNVYLYVGGRPTYATDPSGMETVDRDNLLRHARWYDVEEEIEAVLARADEVGSGTGLSLYEFWIDWGWDENDCGMGGACGESAEEIWDEAVRQGLDTDFAPNVVATIETYNGHAGGVHNAVSIAFRAKDGTKRTFIIDNNFFGGDDHVATKKDADKFQIAPPKTERICPGSGWDGAFPMYY